MYTINHLWERMNYHSKIPYIFNNYIREYDIQKANINILYSEGAISKKLYDRLYNAPRETRQIEIGLMLRDNDRLYRILSTGIVKAKKQLFEANNIQDHEVLCIKNDAVFIIGRTLQHTDFGIIRFVEKNVYTSYMLFDGIGHNFECYYHYDRIYKEENFSIKGLGDTASDLHVNYLTDFIKYIFYEVESGRVEDALKAITIFNKDYVSLDLDIGYYREYNPAAMYAIKNSEYRIWTVPDNIESKKCLDINYNLSIIRLLFLCVSGEYFSHKRNI